MELKWLCWNMYAKDDGRNCNRLFTQTSRFKMFFLLEVKFGCGHGCSTKVNTADIERIMCATVVTFKKKHAVGGRKISFGRYARAGDRNKFA